jgi:hypothetical protein
MRIAAINIAVFAVLLVIAEIAARLFFPEFRGQLFSSQLSAGIQVARSDFKGFAVRVPRQGNTVDTSHPLAIILGDSISNGFGTSYDDIYWVQAARLLQVRNGNAPNFVALAYFGNNLADSARAIEQLAREPGLKIDRVLYQFNFNDVTPFGRGALQGGPTEGVAGSGWFKAFARWRYEYLNRSVFLRVVQHYAGMLARKTSGTCEERGLDALGPYTWSFGSRPFARDAEKQWQEFEAKLAAVKRSSDGAGATLAILVSPLVFDIDPRGLHPYFNPLNFDFSCATIDPRLRLIAIASRLGIRVIDPAAQVRRGFDARVAEGNFTPFYFPGDENHFNATAARYVAEVLAAQWQDASALPH